MSHLPTRLVKVGGSLLDLPDLTERLRNWLALQEPAWNVLIVGGGPFVDRLRQMDHSRLIGEKACHWLAIDLMDITAQMLGAWLPEIPVVIEIGVRPCFLFSVTPDLRFPGAGAGKTKTGSDPTASGKTKTGSDPTASDPTASTVILAPGRFLREKEPDLPGVTLPASWDVTSDSIAARLAVVYRANELILLKSVDPPVPFEDLNALSKAGYVDRFFSRVARSVPNVRFNNLRDSFLL